MYTLRFRIIRAHASPDSAITIARKIGCSVTYVYRVWRESGLCVEGRCSVDNRRPLSRTHAIIGARLVAYRNGPGGLKLISDQAKDFGISVKRLSQMEAGLYDLTLSDCQLICNSLGISLEELVRTETKSSLQEVA